jgi:hypothetical protein
MSIIYLDTKVDPRDTKKETIKIKIDDKGGFFGGKEANVVKNIFNISAKKIPTLYRTNIVYSFNISLLRSRVNKSTAFLLKTI